MQYDKLTFGARFLTIAPALFMFSGGGGAGGGWCTCIYFRYRTYEVQIQYINTSDTLCNIFAFAYCHASVKLENVEVLYLEDGNVYRLVLKNKIATMFFS